MKSLHNWIILPLIMMLVGAFAFTNASAAGKRWTLDQLSAESPLPATCDTTAVNQVFRDTEVEPQIAVNPTNRKNLVATWQADKGAWWGADGMAGAYSFDGGQTWTNFTVPGLTLCTGGTHERVGNNWLSFGPDGTLYLSSVAFTPSQMDPGTYLYPNDVYVSVSADGGQTWSSPVPAASLPAMDGPSVTADPHHAGTAYVATPSWDLATNSSALYVVKTTDYGLTWSTPVKVYDIGGPGTVTNGHVHVLPDASVVIIAQAEDYTSNIRYHVTVRSLDAGATWTTQSLLPYSSFYVDGPDNYEWITGGMPADAMDASSGTLYLVWSDNSFAPPEVAPYPVQIAFSQSTDAGATWSEPILVNQTPEGIPGMNRQAFLPAIAVAHDGRIGVSYFDFRANTEDPGLPTQHFIAFCQPGPNRSCTDAANWGDEQELTHGPFDMLEAVPVDSGAFLGVDMGLTTDRNDFLSAFPTPHLNADGNLDSASVFFRRVRPKRPTH